MWYFFHNIEGTTPLFSRSGLRSITGEKETVFFAFERFLGFLSTCNSPKVFWETCTLWELSAKLDQLTFTSWEPWMVCLFAQLTEGSDTRMVAWRPVSVDDSDVVGITIQVEGWVAGYPTLTYLTLSAQSQLT